MGCPLHTSAQTTKRIVPVEIYPGGDVPPFRIPSAELETCDRCGLWHYDWVAVAKLPVQALG